MNWLQSFSRKRGKNFKEGKLSGIEKYLFTLDGITSSDVILEIGFGYGEHLIWQAQKFPEKIFIGAEVYLNGISKVLTEIKSNNIENIFLWNDDVRILLEKLPGNFLEKVFLLFPDPWPKKRHNKRRIINSDFLKLVHTKLRLDGQFIISTDHEDYSIWIEDNIINSKLFEISKMPSDFLQVTTRYQAKANSNIHVYKLDYA